MNAARNRRTARIVLAAGLTIVAVTTVYMTLHLKRSDELDLRVRCDAIHKRIMERLYDHARILRSGAAFINADEEVIREEWRVYTKLQKIEQQLPGIQGIGVSLLVPRAELARHIAEIRKSGLPDYTVTPPGDREIYVPVVYMEPFSGRNLRTIGYDTFSEPVRRAGMEEARDEDSATLSGKVVLIQDAGEEILAGTVMYVPVYKKGLPTDTVEQRRAAIYGWVYSAYRMDDLMHGILGNPSTEKQKQIHLKLFDGVQTSSENLLYIECPDKEHDHQFSGPFTRQIPVDFNGHHWTLLCSQAGGGFFAEQYVLVWFILIGGITITLLLFKLILVLQDTRGEAQQLAEKLTAELQKERQQLANIIQGTHAGTWEWNVQTGETVFNEMWAQIGGYTPAELAPCSIKTWEALVHPDDLKLSDSLLERHFSGELPFYECDCRMRHKDGHWIWVHDRGRLVSRTDDGKPLLMCGTHEDITDRKAADAQIRKLLADSDKNRLALLGIVEDEEKARRLLVESDERYRQLFERASIGIIILSSEGKIIAVNETYARIDGYRPEELLGTSPEDMDTPESAQRFPERLRRLRAGEILTFEAEHRHKDGHVVPLEVCAGLIKVGDQGYFQSFVRDITARKQAEKALQVSEAKSRAIIDASPVPMALNDEQLIVTFLNPAFIQTFGYTLEDIPTLADWWPRAYPDPVYRQWVAETWQARLEQAKQTGTAFHPLEVSVRCKNGTDKTVLASASSFAGVFKGEHLAVLYDITERKQTEDLLKQKYAELERFNKVTVGREIRMIELKKEINAVLKAAGQPKKYKIVTEE